VLLVMRRASSDQTVASAHTLHNPYTPVTVKRVSLHAHHCSSAERLPQRLSACDGCALRYMQCTEAPCSGAVFTAAAAAAATAMRYRQQCYTRSHRDGGRGYHTGGASSSTLVV
jgi:hypothetical protein